MMNQEQIIANSRRFKVLYVEDVFETRMSTTKLLEKFFFSVKTASNITDALDFFNRESFDFIFTDIMMVNGNGMQLAKEIRSQKPKQPIVFLSAMTDFKVLIESINLHINAFLPKPLNLASLSNTILQLISKSSTDSLENFSVLEEAIKYDRLIPVFQPVISSSVTRVNKFEVLLRIENNNKLISPFALCPNLSESAISTQITESMFLKSVKIASELDINITFNLTQLDLQMIKLIDLIIFTTEKFQYELSRITFEILESTDFEDIKNIQMIERLRSIGCLIAIDDFGIKNSNFSRLIELNPDVIKIDGSFIHNIASDEKKFKIVKSITALAKELNMEVVAEYVSSEEILDIVSQIGVSYYQGYFLGMPMIEDDLREFLNNNNN